VEPRWSVVAPGRDRTIGMWLKMYSITRIAVLYRRSREGRDRRARTHKLVAGAEVHGPDDLERVPDNDARGMAESVLVTQRMDVCQ